MSEPTPARTSRKQFGIRTLLVLMLLTAFFMWWWIQLPEGFITEAESRKIKVGQSRGEVENLLGRPLEERWIDSVPNTLYMAYRVTGSKPEVRAFVITFDYETLAVIGMSRKARNDAKFMADD